MDRRDPVLPLGTVVAVREEKAMVVGHTFAEEEGHMEAAYIVVPYPQGYYHADSLKVAKPSEVEVIAKGYECAEAGYVTGYYDHFNEMAGGIPADKMREYMAEADARLENGGEGL